MATRVLHFSSVSFGTSSWFLLDYQRSGAFYDFSSFFIISCFSSSREVSGKVYDERMRRKDIGAKGICTITLQLICKNMYVIETIRLHSK